jgi:hypothetical protein
MWNQLSGNTKALTVSQEKTGEKVPLSLSAAINSRFKQSALIAIFKWITLSMVLTASWGEDSCRPIN